MLLLLLISLPLYMTFFIKPSFNEIFFSILKNDSVLLSRHISRMLFSEASDLKEVIKMPIFINKVKSIKNDFNLFKIKLYSTSGEIIFSTDPGEIGDFNDNEYFFDIVSRGIVYDKFVEKETETFEKEELEMDLVEIYVPIMSDNKFMGAFEIYNNVTVERDKTKQILNRFSIIYYSFSFSLLALFILYSIAFYKREAARQKTIESSRLWEETFDKIVNGILVYDKDKKIINANNTIANMLGLEKADIIGKNLSELISINGLAARPKILEKVFNSKVEEKFEYFEPKLKKWLVFWDFPILDADNNIEKIIQTVEDITERKESEKEILDRNRQLERFKRVMAGRERRIIALKKEIKNKKK